MGTTYPMQKEQWADGVTIKKLISAPKYVDHLMEWIETQLDNESIFPQKLGAPFPQNFQDVVKTIFKQLFRVYAHIYHLHFQMIMSLKEEAHLNTYCGENFKTFVIKQIETVDKAFENSGIRLFDVNVAMRPHIAQDHPQQCFPTDLVLTINTESKRGDQLMLKLMVSSSSSSNFRRYNRPFENKLTKDGGAILTSNRRNAKSRILDNAFGSIDADVALKSQIGHGHLQQRGVWICCETKLCSIFQSKVWLHLTKQLGLPYPTDKKIKNPLENDNEFVNFIGAFVVEVFNSTIPIK
ncbi:MOB kinase activator-like 1A protein [Tanacetum coccineum]